MDDFTFDDVNSVSENSSLEFSLYPNPSDGGIITLTANQVLGEVFIYDILGQSVYETSVKTQTHQLDLNLPTGMYFLKVADVTRKFLVE